MQNVAALEKVFVSGDLSSLSPDEKVQYILKLCESLGLNPLTRPIEFIKLNGRDTLYAKKSCTDELRKINKISLEIIKEVEADGILTVTVKASTPEGRTDVDFGSVVVAGLKGEQLCNARMKALTKGKRRVTLSVCGLGMLDESELETIPKESFTELPPYEKPKLKPLSLPQAVVTMPDELPMKIMDENEIDDKIADYIKKIGDCVEVKDLVKLSHVFAKENKDVKEAIRGVYKDKKVALEAAIQKRHDEIQGTIKAVFPGTTVVKVEEE